MKEVYPRTADATAPVVPVRCGDLRPGTLIMGSSWRAWIVGVIRYDSGTVTITFFEVINTFGDHILRKGSWRQDDTFASAIWYVL